MPEVVERPVREMKIFNREQLKGCGAMEVSDGTMQKLGVVVRDIDAVAAELTKSPKTAVLADRLKAVGEILGGIAANEMLVEMVPVEYRSY